MNTPREGGWEKKKVEFKSAIAGNDGGVPCIADSFARELSGLSTGLRLIAVSRDLFLQERTGGAGSNLMRWRTLDFPPFVRIDD